MSTQVLDEAAPRAACPVTFAGPIAPTDVSGTYRIGLVLVTVAMILVPLLYLLIVAAAGWLLVWHITTNTWPLTGGRLGQLRLLAYVTPAIAGATLVFFMVKPILARSGRRDQPPQVREPDQPVLFALIREICRQVRAPFPARVFVDCQVNASASLRDGALGLFRRDLDLTIGLPLVTGLSVRQLSGVLAHEFGHFAQGGGMRMTALIRSINAWLFRVVHERDAWDDRLEEWSRDGDWRVTAPLAVARGSVWISRRALAGLTMVGHGVSCYMLRQMEFDADGYEARVVGTDTFESTFTRLRELSAGSHVAHRHLSGWLERRAVPADLARFVAECAQRLPLPIREQVRQRPGEPTGTFDTHPSDADRLAAARTFDASGALIGGDEPATVLFRDLERLSADVTRHHYECGLGVEIGAMRLVTTDEAWRGVEDEERTAAAVQEVFAGRVSLARPLQIPLEAYSGTGTDLGQTLHLALGAIAQSTLSDESYRAYENLQDRRDLAYCAEQLFLMGVEALDAQQFSLPEPTLAAAESVQRWAEQQQAQLRASLDQFDDLVARRLALGVMLLQDQAARTEARGLVDAVAAVAQIVPLALEARRDLRAMAIFEAITPPLDRNPSADAAAGRLERRRAVMLASLRAAPAPAGDVGRRWQHVLTEAPQSTHAELVAQVFDLYWAALSRLARVVTDGEASTSAT